MVIRNSQKVRTLPGRVAMNQAVGRPKMMVMTVVVSDSRTERQKIDKYASANPYVSSKMSRVKKICTQASNVGVQITPLKSPGCKNE